MSDEQLILVERDEERRVALLRFNRPKQLNALNGEVMDALCSALEELDRDEAIRAIVVTGSDRAQSTCCAPTGSPSGTGCDVSASR